MSSSLLPCPFCNSSAMPGVKWAQCSNSACPAFHIHTTNLEAWNRRATQPAAGEPVAWATRSLAGANKGEMFFCDPKEPGHTGMWAKPFPLYAHPPAPLEPIAWIVESPKDLEPVTSVCKRKDLADRFASAGWTVTPAYTAPPATPHRHEAVQYRLLRLGEVILATDELLRDDCTTWQPMSDGPQLGIGREWHPGLVPMRRVEPVMHAQGDEGGRS